MKRSLYHGSPFIIENPIYGKGNIHNDYGLGFYCTSSKLLAKEWASKRTGAGYVNHYFIRDDNLKILDLTNPPFNNVLNWIALLLNNRELSSELLENFPREIDYLRKNYLIDIKNYDVVIGYRADDSYFHFPEAFIRSQITLESLEFIFSAGDLGKQFVLISQKAFNRLKFDTCEKVFENSRDDYYKRKNEADKKFDKLLKEDRYKKGTRLRDLVMDNE